jgi:hypothetical protein
MRAHGVGTTDPDPNTGKSQFTGRFATMSREQILNDPAVKAAETACRNELPSPQPPSKEPR